MNEKMKIKEAKYFLSRMREAEGNYEEFTYNLSAFLSSAYTVLLYCRKEVSYNGNKAWYDFEMNKSDVLKFFTKTRNLVIHVVPCKLQKDEEISIPPFTTGTFFHPVAISSSGNIVYGAPINVPVNINAETVTIHTYRFDLDWYDRITSRYTSADKLFCQGICQKYDVMTFCQKYVDELDQLVSDGISQGFITV